MHPPFPIDESFGARVQDAYRFGAAPRWDDPEAGASLLAQIEPLLGEGADPDPTFFIESWTVGVAAASESYERRRQQKSREAQTAAAPAYSPLLPFFMIEPGSIAPPAGSSVSPNPDDFRDEEEMDPVCGPLTFEAACRLLGVAVNCTREQIKAAYRRMASRYHPDRMAWGGAREQRLASDRMASINEAYRMLCSAVESS